MSFDSVEDNATFAEKYSFCFPLLSDTTREVGLAYGACDDRQAGYASRITYVIDPDLRILHAMEVGDAKRNPAEVLSRL